MLIASIDYSMTCPCICIHNTNKPFNFNTCEFFFLTDRKYLGNGYIIKNIHGTYMDKKIFLTDIERYTAISDWAMKHLASKFRGWTHQIALEGYSMGSRGKTFNIGENTGILKYEILKHNIPLTIYSPKEIKMFAVNNSPIDFSGFNKNKILKPEMYDIFLEETETDLQQILTPKKKKIDSPVSDIIDSYFICKLLREDIESGDKKITES